MAEEVEVTGEVLPLTFVEARVSALQPNPDGGWTASLLVDRISASCTTKFQTPYSRSGEFFTNLGLRPSGDWPVRVRLNTEDAESLAAVMEAGKGVIELISDMHRLLLVIDSEEKENTFQEAARDFNR